MSRLGSVGALQRLDAVLACREAIELNVKPQIAVEAMMMTLFAGPVARRVTRRSDLARGRTGRLPVMRGRSAVVTALRAAVGGLTAYRDQPWGCCVR